MSALWEPSPVRFLGRLPVREHLRPKPSRLGALPATAEELHERATAIGMFAQDLWDELTVCTLYTPGDPAEHHCGWRWDIRGFVIYREVLALPWRGEA
jgi:hypothetical protein